MQDSALISSRKRTHQILQKLLGLYKVPRPFLLKNLCQGPVSRILQYHISGIILLKTGQYIQKAMNSVHQNQLILLMQKASNPLLKKLPVFFLRLYLAVA